MKKSIALSLLSLLEKIDREQKFRRPKYTDHSGLDLFADWIFENRDGASRKRLNLGKIFLDHTDAHAISHGAYTTAR